MLTYKQEVLDGTIVCSFFSLLTPNAWTPSHKHTGIAGCVQLTKQDHVQFITVDSGPVFSRGGGKVNGLV